AAHPRARADGAPMSDDVTLDSQTLSATSPTVTPVDASHDGQHGRDGRGPVAGIDIGGTKIAVLIVDADGAVLGRATRSSSVADQDGAAVAIAACLDEALAAAGLRRDDLDAIGVGVPGRVDPQKGHV